MVAQIYMGKSRSLYSILLVQRINAIIFFQLGVSLASLYAQWKKNDENFAKALKISGPLLEGIRILAQDPIETLFSFICSSNNNIKRISSEFFFSI